MGIQKRGNGKKKSNNSAPRTSRATTRIDPETGQPYHVIPRLGEEDFNSMGFSPLRLDDLDLNNLNAGAAKYLPGRLRKSPSKEELEKLRAQRLKMQMQQEREYAKESAPIDERQEAEEEKIKKTVKKKMR